MFFSHVSRHASVFSRVFQTGGRQKPVRVDKTRKSLSIVSPRDTTRAPPGQVSGRFSRVCVRIETEIKTKMALGACS